MTVSATAAAQTTLARAVTVKVVSGHADDTATASTDFTALDQTVTFISRHGRRHRC